MRFRFIAVEVLFFPRGRAANLFRGALGSAFHAISAEVYARYFEPVSDTGPSGFANPPRPFVLRVDHLDNCEIPEGHIFTFEVNLFDARPEAVQHFVHAAGLMFNVGRIPARLDSPIEANPIRLNLTAPTLEVGRVRLHFLTPTVLDSLEFGVLFSRLRDRISNLRRFYGDGALPLDFREMGQRAEVVKLIASDVRRVRAQRTSRATGQTHPLGGFVGTADYAGDLTEFLPFLEAGYWTGVGSQTVWGNGQIATEVISLANPHPAPVA